MSFTGSNSVKLDSIPRFRQMLAASSIFLFVKRFKKKRRYRKRRVAIEQARFYSRQTINFSFLRRNKERKRRENGWGRRGVSRSISRGATHSVASSLASEWVPVRPTPRGALTRPSASLTNPFFCGPKLATSSRFNNNNNNNNNSRQNR